jgi:hypothetical protein
MIPRRIVDAFRRQDWFTVFVETMIVVLGVFLALQVNNWNEGRKDKALETAYLERIYFDMVRSIEGAERDTPWIEERLRTQEAVLKSLRSGTLADDDKKDFERGLLFFGYIQQPDRNWQTVRELESSGRMSIIRDAGLRELIGRLEEEFEGRSQRNRLNREKREDYKERIADRWEVVDSDFRVGGDQTINYEFDALVRDRQFLNILSHMHQITRLLIWDKERDLAGYRELRDAVVEVLGYVPSNEPGQRKAPKR